jgi:hypothetical protein
MLHTVNVCKCIPQQQPAVWTLQLTRVHLLCWCVRSKFKPPCTAARLEDARAFIERRQGVVLAREAACLLLPLPAVLAAPFVKYFWLRYGGCLPVAGSVIIMMPSPKLGDAVRRHVVLPPVVLASLLQWRLALFVATAC